MLIATNNRRSAFTLIELLVVIAIIAILAAVALPNLLQAQTRSKVSRVKADMHALAVALETYRVDHQTYPFWPGPVKHPQFADADHPFVGYTPPALTTPLAYIETLPRDIFPSGVSNLCSCRTFPYENPLRLFHYDAAGNWDAYYADESGALDPEKAWNRVAGTHFKWALVGSGPDGNRSVTNKHGPTKCIVEFFQDRNPQLAPDPRHGHGWHLYYDPTNGTVSQGDIVLCGPSGDFEFHAVSPDDRH